MTASPTTTTAPGAPISVTATAGIKSARVSWTAPSDDGGSQITGYSVTPVTGGAAGTPIPVRGRPLVTTVEVGGLDSARSYTFTVTATNEAGTGPASDPSNVVEPGSPKTPGKPARVTPIPGNKSAEVSWTAPSDDGGSQITGYSVTPVTGGAAGTPIPVRGSPPGTRKKVTGLVNASSYTFTVTATNAVGTGPASDPSDAVIPAPTPPAPPAGVTATPGNNSARVSWTAPSDDGGSQITGYTVTPVTGGTALTATDVTGSPPATSRKVTGLDNASSYTFTVTATNAVGTGPASAASDEAVPGRRRDLLRYRADDKRPIRGWLAIGLLGAAVVVEVVHASGRWNKPPAQDSVWIATVVLLALALIFAVLWMPAGFSARGRTVPSKSVRRRGALRRTVIVEGVVAVVLAVIWAYAVFGPAHHRFLWFEGRVNFVWTKAWSALAAALIVTGGLLFAHGLARLFSTAEHPADFEPDPDKPESEDEQRRENAIAFRTAGLKGTVVGADGLASTSRLMPALWTVALLFAVVLLLLIGRTPHCPKPLPSVFVNPSGVGGSCPARDLAGTSRFADQLGKNFPWDYLLLLGFPVGAALAAKWQAITYGDKLRAPTVSGVSKPSPPDPQDIGVKAGLSQVISNDAGQGSLVNAQYLAFTLVTIGFVLLQVVTHPRNGLPVIPTALLVLSGVAVGGYVANRQIVGRTTPQGGSAGDEGSPDVAPGKDLSHELSEPPGVASPW